MSRYNTRPVSCKSPLLKATWRILHSLAVRRFGCVRSHRVVSIEQSGVDMAYIVNPEKAAIASFYRIFVGVLHRGFGRFFSRAS